MASALPDAAAPGADLRTLLLLNSLSIGGAEKQTVALFNGLAGAGHQSWLQCLKSDLSLRPQVEAAREPFVLPPLGVDTGIAPWAIRELARRIDERAIDVVVCTNMYALLYASLARAVCRRTGAVRLVEVFHTTDVGSRKERWSMALYRQVVRSADRLVFVCRSQARHWHDQGLRARRDVVIHNGIDTRRFVDRWSAQDIADLRAPFGFLPADLVFGVCAVMRPEKAHGDFLQALHLLRRRGVAAKGLLIGDGPLRADIEAQVRRLDLAAAVRITGYVEDVRPLVAACDAMALTSHAVETFSIAALEAMALGRPMVMTRIGGAAEQVEDGVDGWLYPAGDVPALAEALGRFAQPGRAFAMGRLAAARTRARFDVARMVAQYRDMLEELAARHPKRVGARAHHDAMSAGAGQSGAEPSGGSRPQSSS
jgi:glycosyltransferase involved in cell wall biosynthesis